MTKVCRLERTAAAGPIPRKSGGFGNGQRRSLEGGGAVSKVSLVAEAVPEVEKLGSTAVTGLGSGTEAGYEERVYSGSFQDLLVKKVIEAQEGERRRIARDIHDETEQLLGNAIFRMDMCLMQNPEIGDSAKRDLNKIREILLSTVEGLQRISQSLRPSLLDDLGLEASLGWLFRTLGFKERLKVRWSIAGLKGRLPSLVETALFRIIQEACNNVLKHARAKNLHVRVRVNDSRVVALISDDGVGFDSRVLVSPRAWVETSSIPMGLSGMRERAELVGGRLMIRSRLNKGTRVAAVISLSPRLKELN